MKFQIPSTEKIQIEPPRTPSEEIQNDFTGSLNSKHSECSPFYQSPSIVTLGGQ